MDSRINHRLDARVCLKGEGLFHRYPARSCIATLTRPEKIQRQNISDAESRHAISDVGCKLRGLNKVTLDLRLGLEKSGPGALRSVVFRDRIENFPSES
jgi:hypothetical protein